VKDLGSRNGTWVDGRELPNGGTVILATGSTVSFGTRSHWRLEDAREPLARALLLGSDVEVVEEDGVLVLPSLAQPEGSVTFEDGGWALQRDAESWSLRDGQQLQLRTGTWRLQLPPMPFALLDTTVRDVSLDLSTAKLRFTVSSDWENVQLILEGPYGREELPARTHQVVLVALARARLRDRQAGTPESECGWMYLDELERHVDMDRVRINIELLRARKLMGRHGVQNAGALVERRPMSKRIRIGISDLEIDAPQPSGA
jgi:hypothetical protein